MRAGRLKRYRAVFAVAWAVWFLIVIAGSLLPGQVITAVAPAISDKAAHAIMYSGLALFPALILESRWSLVLAAIAIMCTGLLLEAAQIRIPGRNADWSDVAWNVSGAILEWLASEGILLIANGDATPR